jgi:hypothetical protein
LLAWGVLEKTRVGQFNFYFYSRQQLQPPVSLLLLWLII